MTSLGEWEHNIIPDTIMSSAMGILGTPELFQKSRGKEPSMFEPLQFYCS